MESAVKPGLEFSMERSLVPKFSSTQGNDVLDQRQEIGDALFESHKLRTMELLEPSLVHLL